MRFLGLIAFLFCFNVNAGELSAPQIAIEKYFKYFNSKDKKALDAALDKPFIFNISGKVTRWDNYHDAVDFDGLEKSGWSYSRILKNELIYADDITAMVDVTFSRFNISSFNKLFCLIFKLNYGSSIILLFHLAWCLPVLSDGI